MCKFTVLYTTRSRPLGFLWQWCSVMVMCALPPPLLAILVTLTPPPHDRAKRNTADDQIPSATKHLPSVSERYCAILAAYSCELLATRARTYSKTNARTTT